MKLLELLHDLEVMDAAYRSLPLESLLERRVARMCSGLTEGGVIYLCASQYPLAIKRGINRVLGFDIHWYMETA